MANNSTPLLTCTFAKERETKGAVRYQQTTKDGSPYTIEDGAEIGSIYLRKSAFKNGIPDHLTITIK